MKIEYHKSYNKNEGIFSVASCCMFPWGFLFVGLSQLKALVSEFNHLKVKLCKSA